jgi:acyl dehydratase
MALDPNAVGAQTQTHELEYDYKTLALYALGIGAKREELDYLYEKRGPKAYPSFAVVPAYPVLTELLELSRGPYEAVVHGGQTIRVLRPIPPCGVLKTRGSITGIYDIKLLAQVDLRTETTLDGEPLFETEWQILFRGEGGFGGARRPRPDVPKVPKRDPDWILEETVSPEQALLYRLSGDHNPLHADPEFAASVGFDQGPILHGLCTFGYVCRAVALEACAGDASKIKSLTAQFKKPVWPGETLRTEGYAEGGKIVMQSFAGGRPEAVIAGCFAELAS